MNLSARFVLACIGLLRAVVRFLPQSVSMPLARGLGRLSGRFCPRERRIASAQISYVREKLELDRYRSDWLPADFPPPRFPPAEKTASLVSDVFAHTGQALAESMLLDRLLARDSAGGFRHVDCKGQEAVSEVIEAGRGAITLSGHIGCFELLAAFHIAWGAKVSVIGRSPNYESLSAAVRSLRNSYGVESLWRDDPAIGRKIMKALSANRVVAALIDQDTALDSSYSPFFGLPAATPIGLLRLALRMKIPILTSFIVRTDRGRHTVVTRRVEVDPELPDAEARVLAEFHSHLEELVVRFPDQWLWWHRRWRRQPDHKELPSTGEYLQWLHTLTGA